MSVDQNTINQVMRELGSRGGLARAEKMTAKQRRESAIKASKAAAAARAAKAKSKKGAK